MRIAAIALAFMGLGGLVGCADFEEGETPEQRTIDVFEREALPVLTQTCAACHSGSDPSIGFLEGNTAAEIRRSILASGVVDLEHVESSRLFVKGVHSGPAMTAQQAGALLGWIEAERDLRGLNQ